MFRCMACQTHRKIVCSRSYVSLCLGKRSSIRACIEAGVATLFISAVVAINRASRWSRSFSSKLAACVSASLTSSLCPRMCVAAP
jgi:hypothetical protein